MCLVSKGVVNNFLLATTASKRTQRCYHSDIAKYAALHTRQEGVFSLSQREIDQYLNDIRQAKSPGSIARAKTSLCRLRTFVKHRKDFERASKKIYGKAFTPDDEIIPSPIDARNAMVVFLWAMQWSPRKMSAATCRDWCRAIGEVPESAKRIANFIAERSAPDAALIQCADPAHRGQRMGPINIRKLIIRIYATEMSATLKMTDLSSLSKHLFGNLASQGGVFVEKALRGDNHEK